MRRTYRLALLAVAALSALGFASSAFASFAPKLVVSSSAGGAARIGVLASNADDPTARVSIYIPAGYQVASPAVGTKARQRDGHCGRSRSRRRSPAADG